MEHTEESIFRGEIYYVHPSGNHVDSEQIAGRPAVVVSNDKANRYSPVIEVVYLTTQPKNTLPTHVDITSIEKPSIALCEQINSVSKFRVGRFIAKCTEKEMAMIDGALCVSLGIEQESEQQKVFVPPLVNSTIDADIWRTLYYELLDRLIQNKGDK